MTWTRGVLVRFALFLGMLLPLAGTLAQTSSQILINYPELAEEGDGLALGLYFNVVDSTGRVIPNAQVQSARMLLDDGTGYDATVAQPDSPIYIVLVLDASGSMGGAAQAMRQAAIEAVNNAPDNAQLAVIRFNNNIDVLSEFTEDRNRAINAIGEVQPINLAGTCLYDAAFRAVELANTAPPGRRAIILFTDGRDETAQGTVCSTHVYDEVVDFANQPQSRVPIHTIGLSGGNSAINATELRDLARATGGLAAIGDQAALSSLFQQIMDALKSQWLARAIVYPSQGQHTAQLLVTMADGSFPQPAVAVFTAQRDYTRTPTITPTQPTPTPTIVTVTVDSVAFDPSEETVTVQTIIENEQLITEYRFAFLDENNLLQAEFVVPAPLPERVTFPSRTLRDGDTTVNVTAYDDQRQIVARSEPVQFTYLGPTATPAPATNTPAPVGATVTGIRYDEAADIIAVNLNILGQDQIAALQINVINNDTNLLEDTYNQAPTGMIELSGDGLIPGQAYRVNVIAQGPNGQILSESEADFTYTPLLTPTPTPVLVEIAISEITIDNNAQQFVVRVQAQNETMIDRYQLRVVEEESGLLVNSYEYSTPPYDRLTVPLEALRGGRYEINLTALDEQGATVDSATVEVLYAPPTPTPTATPLSGIPAVMATVRGNPIIAVVIALIAISLILLLFLLLRQPRRQKTGTGFLQELTSVQEIPQSPQQAGKRTTQEKSGDPNATNAVPFPAGDPNATNVVPHVLLPAATLRVVRSRDAALNGRTIAVTHVPFRLGRRGRDANFEADDNVSRNHAEITYRDGAFYIRDEGSTHGTAVNNTRVAPNTPQVLAHGDRIMLGTTTLLTFESDGDGESTLSTSYDPDSTNF